MGADLSIRDIMVKQSFDADFVRQLAKLLDETGLSELEYDDRTIRIRVARHQPPSMISFAAPAAGATSAAMMASATLAGARDPAAEHADHPGMVRSPMIGQVYLSPEPAAKPFVAVGDTVRAGQTLLIIEAMKVMNPLVAPRSGKVLAVLVQDGQPVEYNEPLIILES